MGPPNSVKNSEWCKLSDCTKQPWYLECWVMKIEWWVMSDGNWMIKKVNQTGPKCLFGWREFWVISSCFHNSWSKTGGAHGRSLFWTPWLMIRDLVSITQFSDFWVMSYGNWKHLLAVFSFHNSKLNGIFVIKHTWGTHSAAIFDQLTFFFFSFSFSLVRSSSQFVFFFFFFFFFTGFGLIGFILFFFFFPFFFTGFGVLHWFFFFFLSSSLGSEFFTGFCFFFSFLLH